MLLPPVQWMIQWLLFIYGCAWSSMLQTGCLWLWCLGFLLGWLLLLHGLQGTWAPVAMAHGLSCLTEYGIFPNQGLNPCPLHWQVGS